MCPFSCSGWNDLPEGRCNGIDKRESYRPRQLALDVYSSIVSGAAGGSLQPCSEKRWPTVDKLNSFKGTRRLRQSQVQHWTFSKWEWVPWNLCPRLLTNILIGPPCLAKKLARLLRHFAPKAMPKLCVSLLEKSVYLRRGALDFCPDGTLRHIFARNYFACSLSSLFVRLQFFSWDHPETRVVLKRFCSPANPRTK